MSDYNLWVNDIEHRFSPTSLTHTLNGSIYTAFAVISSVTTRSGERTSLFNAYESLRERLLEVGENTTILPLSTTTERDALTNIENGTVIENITIGRNEFFDGLVWRNVSRKSSVTGITASTTQSQGNGALTGDVNVIAVCANINDTVTLETAIAGITIIVINNGAKKLQIFPASGDDLGNGIDASVTLAAGSVIVFDSFDTTTWVST